MNQRVLFPEPSVPNTRWARRTDSAVRWYEVSTRDEARHARRKINSWYGEIHDPKGSWRKRLRSENNVEHVTALDELYVHRLLCASGWADIRYEEQARAPDFRVFVDGQLSASVEVLSLWGAEDKTGISGTYARLADDIEDRVKPTHGWFISFEVEEAVTTPSSAKFAAWIRQRIASLGPPPVGHVPLEDWPREIYERPGLRIKCMFIPTALKDRADDPEASIIALSPITVGFVSTGVRLKDRIEDKAGSRYELKDRPYVVAVCHHDLFWSDDQLLQALYGSAAVYVGSGMPFRRNDGIFGADKNAPNGRNTRVSAVAAVQSSPNHPEANCDLMLNPFAKFRVPDDLLPTQRSFGPVSQTANGVTFGWIENAEPISRPQTPP